MPEQNEGYRPDKMAENRKTSISETRDIYREHATELQQGVAEPQAAKYETILYRLMNRTNTDPELINALNGFLSALDNASRMGREDEPFHARQIEGLSSFFTQQAEHIEKNLEQLSQLGNNS